MGGFRDVIFRSCAAAALGQDCGVLNALRNLVFRPVTAEAFTEEAAQQVKGLEGDFRVEVAGPLELNVYRGAEAEPVRMQLGNAYHIYLTQRSHRKEIIQRYVQSLVSMETDTLLPKDIIPTIKDKGYVPEMRQQFAAKGGKPEDFFVEEPFNEALSVVYAVDSANSIRYLNPADLPELNLQGQTLRELAIDNLKRVLPGIEVLGDPPLFALRAGGMFESSLLLLDRVWNKEQLRIEGDILVAVPSRETVLVADGNHAEASAQIRVAAQKLAASAPYRLTDQVFIRRGAGFELLPG